METAFQTSNIYHAFKDKTFATSDSMVGEKIVTFPRSLLNITSDTRYTLNPLVML
jgi:hypothetical protein